MALTAPIAPTLPPSPGNLAERLTALGERARSGEAGARGELRRACEMLEAHFVTWLLREMRATVPHDDGLLPHDATDEMYESLFDDTLARTIAHGGGVGIARTLEARLAPRVGLSAEAPSGSQPGSPDPGLRTEALGPQQLGGSGAHDPQSAIPNLQSRADRPSPESR